MKHKHGGGLRCILHIGPIKSGSTSLQHFCFANRERLLQQHGVLYPLTVKDPASDIHSHILLSRAKPDHMKQKLVPALRNEIQAAVARGARTVLFSDEETQYVRRDADKIRDLLEVLREVGCGRPRIVVYLREPAGLFLSLCAQSALAGDARIWEEVMPENNFQWRQAVNHKATLDLWRDVCGRERVFPRLLDRKGFEGGSLERDFFAAAGLEWDEGFTIPPPQNESFPAAVVELVRALNAISSGGTFTAQNFKFNIVRQLKRLHADGQDRELPGLMAPPRVYEAYRNFYLNDYEAIRAEWFPQREQLFALRDMDEYAAAWKKYPHPDRRGMVHIAKLCSMLAIGEAVALGTLKKAGLPLPGQVPLPPKKQAVKDARAAPPGAPQPQPRAPVAGPAAAVPPEAVPPAVQDGPAAALTAAEGLQPTVTPPPLPAAETPAAVPAAPADPPADIGMPEEVPAAAPPPPAAPADPAPVSQGVGSAAPAGGGTRSVLEEVLGGALDPQDAQALRRAERTLYRRQNSLTPQQLQQASTQLRSLMQAAGVQSTLPPGEA